MKNSKVILSVLMILFAMTVNTNSKAYSQTPQKQEERTESQKRVHRILETRDEGLSLEEQLCKYRLGVLINENYYAEDGELKTRVTEKMVTDAGLDPYWFILIVEGVKEANEYARKQGMTPAQMEEMFQRGLEDSPELVTELKEKVADLERRIEEEKKRAESR